MPTLVEACEVRETNLLDVVGGSRKLLRYSDMGSGRCCETGLCEEVVGEKVPVAWLTLRAPHGDKVGGVNTISKELKAKSWSEWINGAWSNS
jgi:hypothetical protein